MLRQLKLCTPVGVSVLVVWLHDHRLWTPVFGVLDYSHGKSLVTLGSPEKLRIKWRRSTKMEGIQLICTPATLDFSSSTWQPLLPQDLWTCWSSHTAVTFTYPRICLGGKLFFEWTFNYQDRTLLLPHLYHYNAFQYLVGQVLLYFLHQLLFFNVCIL